MTDARKKIRLNPPLPKEVLEEMARNTLKPLYERQAQEAEARLRNLQPGDIADDGTIYLGRYAPVDRNGNSLSKTFNVYAAPEDLPETMKYVDAVKHIAQLKKWHGYDGTNYPTDKEIYAALKDGSYKGGWIIPTRELLVGTEPDGESGVRKGKVIQPDNLFDHQNKGAFKGTFKTAASSGSGFPVWYWSSTEHRDDPFDVWVVRLSDGNGDWFRKDYGRLSCRPVRLAPV
jgi:hypothetical protein